MGSPEDGFFVAAPGITILGGDSTIFNPPLAGSYPLQYYFTDANGCTDTVVYAYTDGNLYTNYDTLIFEIRDYDFRAGARILKDIDNWCSPDAFYTTQKLGISIKHLDNRRRK